MRFFFSLTCYVFAHISGYSQLIAFPIDLNYINYNITIPTSIAFFSINSSSDSVSVEYCQIGDTQSYNCSIRQWIYFDSLNRVKKITNDHFNSRIYNYDKNGELESVLQTGYKGYLVFNYVYIKNQVVTMALYHPDAGDISITLIDTTLFDTKGNLQWRNSTDNLNSSHHYNYYFKFNKLIENYTYSFDQNKHSFTSSYQLLNKETDMIVSKGTDTTLIKYCHHNKSKLPEMIIQKFAFGVTYQYLYEYNANKELVSIKGRKVNNQLDLNSISKMVDFSIEFSYAFTYYK